MSRPLPRPGDTPRPGVRAVGRAAWISAHLLAVGATALALRLSDVPRVLPALVALPLLVRLARGSTAAALVGGRWGRRLVAAAVPVALLGALHQVEGAAGGALPIVLVLFGLGQMVLLARTARPDTTFLVVFLAATQVVATLGRWETGAALALVLAFGLALGWTVLVLERDQAVGRTREGHGTRRIVVDGGGLPRRALGGAALRLALRVLPLALLFYVVAPRSLGAWVRSTASSIDAAAWLRDQEEAPRRPEGSHAAAVGPDLRDNASAVSVAFGGVAQIQRSMAAYFEVRVRGMARPPADLILRDSSLTRVAEDGSWDAPEARVREPRLHMAGDDGRVVVDERPGLGTSRVLEVTVLQGGHRRLFLEPAIVDVAIERGGAPWSRYGITQRDDGMWQATQRFRAGDRIVQTSRPLPRDDALLFGRRSDAAVSPLLAYMQLPSGLDERLRAIAEEVVGTESDPWRRARALERWLRGPEFVYSLQQPPLDPEHRIEDFLVRVRQGHCECYATALVVLLRSLGHPARWVRGFWGGDRTSDERGTLVVRGVHYHAWAELYLDGIGWLALNPTPPDRRAIDAETHSVETGFVRGTEAWADLDRDGWGGLWSQVGSGLGWAGSRLFGPASGWLGIPLLLLLGLALRRRLQRADAGSRSRSGARGPAGPYAEVLGLLRAAGVERRPAATPRELESQAVRRHPRAARALRRLTAWQERACYGGVPWPAATAGELAALRAALQPPAADPVAPTAAPPRPAGADGG